VGHALADHSIDLLDLSLQGWVMSKSQVQWEKRGGYIRARIGHLFLYIDVSEEDYKTPGHPDYDPAAFDWYIAVDDEDKNYRRALASGREATLDAAKARVEVALREIISVLVRDVEKF
jgi:hypothetical protein